MDRDGWRSLDICRIRSRVTPYLADLIQRLGLPVGQPEPHGHHVGLAFGQRVGHPVQLLLRQREADRLAGLDRLGVLDQVAELAVTVLAERGVQRDRLRAYFCTSMTFSGVMSSPAANSPGVGSQPFRASPTGL